MIEDYTCVLISNKPEYYNTLATSLYPEKLYYLNGDNFPSFSKLVNSAVFACPTETVIIMSDRVLPTTDHVKKVINLLSDGFGFVGLYRFAFFGFQKELFRKIGVMDERYISGEYEDDDFYIRLKEANIAMYLTEEIPYRRGKSGWNRTIAKEHFMNKWGRELSNNRIYRYMPEVSHLQYNLELPNLNKKYLPWSHTVCITEKGNKYTQFYSKE